MSWTPLDASTVLVQAERVVAKLAATTNQYGQFSGGRDQTERNRNLRNGHSENLNAVESNHHPLRRLNGL